jgi:hypothetical protein
VHSDKKVIILASAFSLDSHFVGGLSGDTAGWSSEGELRHPTKLDVRIGE